MLNQLTENILSPDNVLKYDNYEDFFEDNNLPKFDVIVGNPPYSEAAGKNKASKIWIHFLKKVIAIDCKFGIIIPNNFLLSHHTSYKLLKTRNINYVCQNLKPLYFTEIKESIGYIIGGLNTDDTVFIDTRGMVLPLNWDSMIPTDVIDEVIISINNKVFNSNTITLYRDKTKESTEGETIMLSNWDNKRSNSIQQFPNVPKLFISRILKRTKKKRTIVSIYDDTGNKCIQDGYFIITDNKDLSWCYSKSKLFSFISGLYDKSQYCNPTLLKKLPKIAIGITNDEELYKYFNITKEEIEYIENNLK